MDKKHFAVVDLVPYGPTDLLMTRINVPEHSRGKGIGSRLLKRVLKAADESNQTIWLEILSSGPLGFNALTSWYKRNDFKTVRIAIMKRTPQ